MAIVSSYFAYPKRKLFDDVVDEVDGVAPSLRPRLAALSGVAPVLAEAVQPAAKSAQSIIAPFDSFDAFINGFLHVLEDTSDPLRIEQVIDGLGRHGADTVADFDRMVGPLAKRASQILKIDGDTTLRHALAYLALGYATRTEIGMPEHMAHGSTISLGWARRHPDLGRQSFVTVFIKRNIDLLAQVQKGLRLPLLCAPTDDRGFVAPQVLLDRISAYDNAGAAPGPYDLGLALMRLAPEGREVAMTALNADTEIMRALHFALGGKLNIGKVKWLWAAAAAARLPRSDEPRIAELCSVTAPDVGIMAQYDVSISTEKSDIYVFHYVEVITSPAISKPLPDSLLSGLFHLTTAGNFSGCICGHNADSIRWASLAWPLNLQPFFAQGVDVFDNDQKLSNSPYAAFIEPMLMPHVTLGLPGSMLLAQTIASADPAVRGLAIEVLITGIFEDRIDSDLLAQSVLDLITMAMRPTARWTRVFGEVANISTRHATYLCQLVTRMMRFDPATPPRDMGGMLELLFELHVQTGARLADDKARACLGTISAGGKLGKFSKMLLAL